MRFDDRLLTVLNQPAGDRHDSAVRWRQLVDLVARGGSSSGSPVVASALEEIRSKAREVDENLRAAAARAVAAFPLPLGLLEYFASDRLAVSAPVLAAAKLDEGQWRVLLEGADEESRRFIETLHPELRQEPLDLTERLVEPEPPEPPKPPEPQPPARRARRSAAAPSLHDVVERIERRRRARTSHKLATAAAHQLDSPALFRWECGPSGEIAWVDGAPRGALVGRSIARPQEPTGDRVDQEVVRAFALRAPFRNARMSLAGGGAVAGEWKISGVPAFEPTDGRFAGYRGIALRDLPPAEAEAAPPTSEILSDPDSLRELVHELKTPLNAIIGFAEIIDGQYLGPADRSYRERAAEIVGQARLLLTAIDDLDFAAKVHASRRRKPRVELYELVEHVLPALRELATAHGAELDTPRAARSLVVAVDPELAERLLMRLGSALIERAGEGERLRITIDQSGSSARVAISRPAALHGYSEAMLFGAGGPHEASFGLRLARGLAQLAGVRLVASDSTLALAFPAA